MSRIDLGQLKTEIQGLNRHKQLYKVLKEELTKRGWWKNKPRGNPKKAYQVSRGLNKKER
jgi:hypothetical protein